MRRWTSTEREDWQDVASLTDLRWQLTQAALERLPLNRELVTIRTDVELDASPTTLALREQDVPELVAELLRLANIIGAEAAATAAATFRGDTAGAGGESSVQAVPDEAVGVPG